jgi:hypothetical protein
MENAIWSKARGSVTANATAAPDGTTTADLWTEDTSNGTHDIRQGITTSSGGFYTFSIYAKANGRSVLDVYVGGANKSANFNLTTGLVTGGSAPIRKIENVGSDWYRISVGCLAASTTTTAIWILNNGSTQSYTGDGTSGMYFWGAQAEQSLVARDYIKTTTAAVYGGITDNTPRLDYTDSSCPALLLEPQRTNLITQSEYFNDSGWFKLGVGAGTTAIVTDNYAVSPEGLQNATRLQLDLNGGTSSGDQSLIYDAISVSAGDNTRSIYVKSNDGNNYDIYFGGTLSSYEVKEVTNEWTRIDAKRNFSSAGTGYFSIGLRGSTGCSDTADILIYGAQLEAGSYPTSYIPTYGSSVSRVADNMTLQSMSNNVTSGVSAASLYVNYEYTLNSLNDAFCFGQNNNFYPAGRGYIYSTSNGFADSFGGGGFSITQGADTKTIWRLNTFSNTNIFQNGVKGSTRTGTAWEKVDQITFRGAFGTIRLKEMILFNQAITDQEAIDLTTI